MSNLQDWKASLNSPSVEVPPHIKKRGRTKSADLTTTVMDDISLSTRTPDSATKTALGYCSGPETSNSSIDTDGYHSDEEGDETHHSTKTKETQKPVAKLRKTLSEKFRRENRVSTNDENIMDEIEKTIRRKTTSKQIQKILKKLSHIDQTDSNGKSLMHFCASVGNEECVKLLLKRNANINLQDNTGFSPLHCSVLSKDNFHLNLFCLLLSNKEIDVTIKNSQNSTVLHYLSRVAVFHEDIVLLRRSLDLLIAKGIDIDAKNKFGETAVHSACLSGNFQGAAFLIERGADCNQRNGKLQTPLHVCVVCESSKLVRMLMENGADPTAEDEDGKTPVDFAEDFNFTDILDCFQAIIEEEIICQAAIDFSSVSIRGRMNNIMLSGSLALLTSSDDWNQSWAVLNNHHITCYEDEQKRGDALLQLNVAKVEIKSDMGIRKHEEEELWCFELKDKTSSNIFGAKTAETREGWIRILRKAEEKRSRLNSIYEKLKTLSKPRQRLRARERNMAYHSAQEGIRILSAAVRSGSKDEFFRLLLVSPESSAAALSELVDPDEDLIRSLVRYFLHKDVLLDFLRPCITHDIRKTTVGETLFREMSLSTRLLSIYLEMEEGQDYLASVALDFIHSVLAIDHSLEVNPNALGGEKVNFNANIQTILSISQRLIDRVLSSADRSPLVFRELMVHTKQTVDRVFPNMTHAVIGSFFFLRFLCPALIAPQKFGLTSKPLDKNALRVCVLVTKLCQSVSNGVELDGSKENYMSILNKFIKENRLYVVIFFDALTNVHQIETQKSQAGRKPVTLKSQELAQIESEIFTHISSSKEKMMALLNASHRVKLDDSDDENSAVEADEHI